MTHETDMQAFERLLKSSPHFNDVINSHRRATAAVTAQVFAALIGAGQLDAPAVLDLLRRMESEPGTPSDGSARRLAVSMVRDELAALSRGR